MCVMKNESNLCLWFTLSFLLPVPSNDLLSYPVGLVPRKAHARKLHDHPKCICICCWLICNLRFTDIYPTGGSNGEHQDLIDRLADKARAYRMKVSTEKNTIIINSTNNLSEDLA